MRRPQRATPSEPHHRITRVTKRGSRFASPFLPPVFPAAIKSHTLSRYTQYCPFGRARYVFPSRLITTFLSGCRTAVCRRWCLSPASPDTLLQRYLLQCHASHYLPPAKRSFWMFPADVYEHLLTAAALPLRRESGFLSITITWAIPPASFPSARFRYDAQIISAWNWFHFWCCTMYSSPAMLLLHEHSFYTARMTAEDYDLWHDWESRLTGKITRFFFHACQRIYATPFLIFDFSQHFSGVAAF